MEMLPVPAVDIVNTHIAENREPYGLTPAVRLKDGSLWSIQASTGHYCSPKSMQGPYTMVELLVIEGDIPDLFKDQRSDDHLFGWLPVTIVNAAIVNAGGIDALVL